MVADTDTLVQEFAGACLTWWLSVSRRTGCDETIQVLNDALQVGDVRGRALGQGFAGVPPGGMKSALLIFGKLAGHAVALSPAP